MRPRQFIGLAVLLGGFLATAGCGSKEPAKITVRGRVFYRGAPLHGGAIVFAPDVDRGNAGALVKGVILDDGSFSITSDAAQEVAPGWYRVAIATRPSEESAIATAANPYPGPPSRYRNPQRSGMTGEVRPGAENIFEFQIDD